MATMELASIPRELPQFGRHLSSLARPASEVFGQQGARKGKGSCQCGGGKGSCGCGGGNCSSGCGSSGCETQTQPPHTQDPQAPASPGPYVPPPPSYPIPPEGTPCPCVELAKKVDECNREKKRYEWTTEELNAYNERCQKVFDEYDKCYMQWMRDWVWQHNEYTEWAARHCRHRSWSPIHESRCCISIICRGMSLFAGLHSPGLLNHCAVEKESCNNLRTVYESTPTSAEAGNAVMGAGTFEQLTPALRKTHSRRYMPIGEGKHKLFPMSNAWIIASKCWPCGQGQGDHPMCARLNDDYVKNFPGADDWGIGILRLCGTSPSCNSFASYVEQDLLGTSFTQLELGAWGSRHY